MSDHILIRVDELLAALEEVEPCPDCAGGRGVHVDLVDGEWTVVAVHSVPCPATAKAGEPR